MYFLIYTCSWCWPLFFQCSSAKNIFDDLPALSAPLKSDLHDELNRYLSMDPEHVTDAITWWHEKRSIYPRLHRMALDYLTIPGMFLYYFIIIIISIDNYYLSYISWCRACLQSGQATLISHLQPAFCAINLCLNVLGSLEQTRLRYRLRCESGGPYFTGDKWIRRQERAWYQLGQD